MTDTDDKIAIAIKKNQPDWPKWLGVIFTVISLTIAAVVWASTEHDDLKTWTSEQQHVIKQELKQDSKDMFVPKEDFSRVEQCLEDQKEDIRDIKNKVDKIFDAIHSRRHE